MPDNRTGSAYSPAGMEIFKTRGFAGYGTGKKTGFFLSGSIRKIYTPWNDSASLCIALHVDLP